MATVTLSAAVASVAAVVGPEDLTGNGGSERVSQALGFDRDVPVVSVDNGHSEGADHVAERFSGTSSFAVSAEGVDAIAPVAERGVTTTSLATSTSDEGTVPKETKESDKANRPGTTTTSLPKKPTSTRADQPTTTSVASSSTSVVAGDVRFKPGDAVAQIVANSPNGSVFVFSPGVYEKVSVQPKSGQVFAGESGAVLNGKGAEYAFRSGEPNVTIKGLVIEGYKPGSRNAVIEGTGGSSGWTIEGNVIRNNGEKGVDARSGWRVVDNTIRENGRYGVTGSGDGIVVSGNEISYNSTEYGATGDSGGTKFVHTEGLVLRGNYVHDNHGNGLWVDINNVNALIEGNRVIGNRRAGVFIEISCGGTIRNNRVEKNGFDNPYPNWMAGSSGIQVANSPNVKIYGNDLSGNAKGIGALQVDHQNLGAVSECDPRLKNLKVYDNVISQSGGAAAGLDANNSQGNVFSSWGNTFDGNTYKLSNGARFRWEGNWISHDQWTSEGNS